MKHEVIEIVTQTGDFTNRLRKLLTQQIGITVVHFEETNRDNITNFKITCFSIYQCYQLGLLHGRDQILSKTNIE